MVEFDIARLQSVEGMVTTDTDMLSRMEFRSSLTDYDLARKDKFVYKDNRASVSSSGRGDSVFAGSLPNFLTPNRRPAESLPFFVFPPPRFVDVRIWTYKPGQRWLAMLGSNGGW